MRQTDPNAVELLEYEPDAAYVTLADIHVSMRQQGAFGDTPTREHVEAELRERAATLGAHAVILVRYGKAGSSWWSYNELRGSGRAIRYR
ncbi:MAG: hypothetical protein ACXWP4_14785 [Polyangiales bacterium]